MAYKMKIQILSITISIIMLTLIFHFTILFGLIPYDQVWAGRLTSLKEMYRFEAVSILINLFVLIILFIKRRMVVQQKQNRWIDYLLKGFGVLFALNTVGNFFAESKLELILGSVLTLTLSILFFLISMRER